MDCVLVFFFFLILVYSIFSRGKYNKLATYGIVITIYYTVIPFSAKNRLRNRNKNKHYKHWDKFGSSIFSWCTIYSYSTSCGNRINNETKIKWWHFLCLRSAVFFIFIAFSSSSMFHSLSDLAVLVIPFKTLVKFGYSVSTWRRKKQKKKKTNREQPKLKFYTR